MLKTIARLTTTLACFSCLLAIPARAQSRLQATFDLTSIPLAITSLDGLWRFHPGDDPDGRLGWSNPGFDDSSWPLLHSDASWSEQGYEHYGGFAWYRFKVIVPAKHGQLAIGIPRLLTSYQVFANGQKIGEFGGLPPHEKVLLGFNQLIPVPIAGAAPTATSSVQIISIAIRVWHFPWFAPVVGGGASQAARFGELALVEAWKTDQNHRSFWQISSSNILMLINLLAAITGLALFAARPAEREYLWFGIYELLTGVNHLVDEYPLFFPAPWHGYWFLAGIISEASWLFFLFFVFRILNGRRDWRYWIPIAAIALHFLSLVAALETWIGRDTWSQASIALVPYFVCILLLLYQGARRGAPDARLLLVPVAICYGSWFTLNTYGIFYTAGQTWIAPYFAWFFQITQWPFPISVQDVADLLMLLSIVAILPLRFARTRRDEQRFAAELDAARSVQQVLIPEAVPSVPGFVIRSLYRPAGQIGGDFFQVIPIPSGSHAGSVLIVIGDVSGKGTPAALTVSLLVGTVRTLAHYTQSPGESLRAMNQRMLARSNGGFTTCLILRIDAQGTLVIANAGHIPPYLNGRELVLENGFPLGLSADAAYPESTMLLPPQTQLTLLTDGIPEARNASGELFGFDRTAALATESAEEIARAAQQFGQDDDITVLTLSRLAPDAAAV